MTHIMTEQRYSILGTADRLNLFLGLCLLHIHKLAALLGLPFFLVLFKIEKQKQQIKNTDHKAQKFHDHIHAGIHESGINRSEIIKQIINKRQKA